MQYNKIIYATFVAAALTNLTSSCDDSFMDEKKNYDNVNTDIYNYVEGVDRRINDLYAWCLPTTVSGDTWNYPSNGSADNQSKSTEEYAGFSKYVDPNA